MEQSTINLDDSPFSTLDVWCDWNGDPEEPVSITISMEAWTRPNLNLPILNAQSPNVTRGPKEAIYLKADIPDSDIPTPPEKENRVPSQYNDDTELYSVTGRVTSYSESVVVHDGSRDDGSTFPVDYAATQDDASDIPQGVSRHDVDISTMYTQVDSPDSPTSPNPRKRSAKTASLPDSIPPEDEYNGNRHKLAMTTIDPQPQQKPPSQTPSIPSTPSTPSKPGKTSSSIPISTRRSANLHRHSATSGNTTSPETSAREPRADLSSVQSEPLPLKAKRATVENILDETPAWHDPETPPNKVEMSSTEPLTEANLFQRNRDTSSLRVCNGSLPDTDGSDEENEDLPHSLSPLGSSSKFSSREFNQLNQSQLHLPRFLSAKLAPKNDPKLVLDNGILYLQTSPNVHPATYKIGIMLKIRLQRGKSNNWWELVISGLPRLAQFESGYLYFRTPPGQGMEFVTSSFKRHTLVESCLMAQFDGGKSLVAPFRKCDAKSYGYLKDYKVNTVIQAEMAEARDPSLYVIKYNAVCSIDLINHNFWAEKCRFHLDVHGGPEGYFDGVLDAEKPLMNILRLKSASTDRVGISHMDIISIPQALGMFTVTWEVALPRDKAVTWLPWIKSTLSNLDVENALKEDYALFNTKPSHVYLENKKVVTSFQAPCSRPGAIHRSEPELSRPLATEILAPNSLLGEDICIHNYEFNGNPFAGNLVFGSPVAQSSVTETPAIFSSGQVHDSKLKTFGNPSPEVSVSQSTIAKPTDPVEIVAKLTAAETPIASPKKPHYAVRVLWGLWSLIESLFYWLTLLASVHIIYQSYMLLNNSSRLDSIIVRSRCPKQNVCIHDSNGFVARALTFAELATELDGLLAGNNSRLELTGDENKQIVNATIVNDALADTTFVDPAIVDTPIVGMPIADTPIVENTVVHTVPMPLRDRIDYFLGWRGPIERG
ncbi:hypothetical protein N7457_007042 [Penicillium paradoxum]|uniref:uncharacterized protein n=1 Tax=Penicillium paradoxum TaxID=176176 RepID=UPI0025489503|nr:uncharacterized protein N7457_007042 [Penicillium paradoxum]KAJ5779322.1 hypothetical protein N7457_007042 [Penicillium paradoxum]